MRRSIAFIGLFTIAYSTSLLAQNHHNVVQAEKAFAQLALDSSVKKAFLRSMDSNAVVFNAGQIQAALPYWQKNPDQSFKLLWQPEFYAQSAAGDLGFTTGPWEFRKSLQDSIAGCGQYTTVWFKNARDEWKFLIDMGVNYPLSRYKTATLRSANIHLISSTTDSNIATVEMQFIKQYHQQGSEAYANHLTTDSWFNLEGKPPLRKEEPILNALSRFDGRQTFTLIGSGLSASKDLGYAFGNFASGTLQQNYLRIWAHTQQGWKILLQVIG